MILVFSLSFLTGRVSSVIGTISSSSELVSKLTSVYKALFYRGGKSLENLPLPLGALKFTACSARSKAVEGPALEGLLLLLGALEITAGVLDGMSGSSGSSLSLNWSKTLEG